MRGNNGTDFYELDAASHLDILVPPAVAMATLILGVLLQSVVTQPHWWRCCCSPAQRRPNAQHLHTKPMNYLEMTSHSSALAQQRSARSSAKHTEYLFTDEDALIIHKFSMFQNNPMALLRIAAPALVSIAFCPVTIYIQPKILDFFYPSFMGGRRDINDALALFLLPAGLVYAMAFAFALQDTHARFDVTKASVDRHLTLLRHCKYLIGCCDEMSTVYKCKLFYYLVQCTIDWMKMQMKLKCGYARDDSVEKIIRTIQQCKRNVNCDEKLMDTLFDKALELDSLITEGYRGAKPNINALQWIFMEALGFISFFGILLIFAESYRLELTMCVLTVFTISAFVYILTDLDHAYHGSFIVDLSVFCVFLDDLSKEYSRIKMRESMDSAM